MKPGTANGQRRLRRLPGHGRKTFGLLSVTSTRLYLEEDHLLYVANDRFSESYMRFYFRDIQALVLCRTDSGKIANGVLGGIAGLFAALGLLGDYFWGWGGAGLAVCGSIAAFFLLLLIINTVKGPTCLCQLKTAVHTEELPSLNRIQTARKAFDLLRPEIEAAQAQLAAPAAPASSPESDSIPSGNVPAPGFSAIPLRAVKHEHGRFHEMVCYLLLLDSVLTSLDIFYDSLWLTLTGSVLGVATLASTVMALVRQYESDLGKGLRSLLWGVLGYQGVMLVFGFVFAIYLTVTHNVRTDNEWEMLKAWSMESALQSPVLLGSLTFSAVTSLVLGLAGLALLHAHRRAVKAPPPLGPPTETPTAVL